jgi:hypothetical protein
MHHHFVLRMLIQTLFCRILLETAKFEVPTALLFCWLAGLKTYDLPTGETGPKTNALKVDINICIT